MAEIVNPQITDAAVEQARGWPETLEKLSSVAYSNLVQSTNMVQQDGVAQQQATNELAIAVVGAVTGLLSGKGPSSAGPGDGVGEGSGGEVGEGIAHVVADLKAGLQSILEGRIPRRRDADFGDGEAGEES